VSGVHPRWNNLVAGWPLNETSDGSASVQRADVLGALTLTDNNTTPSAAGQIGNAASFASASNESLSRADSAAFDAIAGTNGFTINCWIKWTANSPFAKDTGGVNREWLLYQDGDWYVFQADATWQKVATGLTADGNFHMYTLGWNPANGKVFAYKDDGAIIESAGTLTSVQNTTTALSLGKYPVANSFTGLLDEFYIFSGAKDATWKTAMYNAGAGRSYPD
jgi:hypothetical protein